MKATLFIAMRSLALPGLLAMAKGSLASPGLLAMAKGSLALPGLLALAALVVVIGLPAAPAALAAAPKPPKPAAAKPDPDLAALWQHDPLTLSDDALRVAGATDANKDLPFDYLLDRLEVRYAEDGRARTMRHLVFRYRTREAIEALGTFDVPYSPWYEDRPVIRGRVVPARGAGVEIDARTIAEAAAKNPELIVSDRKNLVVPFPHLGIGATVELVIEQSDRRSPYGAPVRNGFHTRTNGARATIVHVEAPAGSELRMKALDTDADIAAPKVAGRVVKHAEVLGILTRMAGGDKPRGLMWSVAPGPPGKDGAHGWDTLAQAYAQTLAPVMTAPSGWQVDAKATRAEKIATIVERVAKELRYTGLHLGDAAIVPFAPKDTLARGYGDCKDLATLVVRALGDAGIDAKLALLRAGDALTVDAAMPGLDLFDHAIVYVPAQGGEPASWIDATAPELGVGPLPAGDLERLALVIDPATTAPTPTPARTDPAQTDVYHVDIEYRPEPIGPGRARVTYTFGGGERYGARRRFGGSDGEALAELERDVARGMRGQVVKAEVAGIDDARAPIRVTLELDDVRILDSDGRSHTLGLGMNAALGHFDYGLFEADRRFAFALPRPIDIALTYRIVPPKGYRAAELPKDADVALGPLRWKVGFVEGADGVVTARGRYEVPVLDLDAAALGAVQDAADKRGEARDFELRLVPEQGKLAPLERAAWFRKELAVRPKDAELRARWALELDKWGVSDEARKEIDIAAKDVAPKDAGSRFVLTTRARLWERDTFGRVYKQGWDRKRAIAAWRAVLGLDPKSVWARHELADILVRDEAGALKKKRDKEGDEGRALLEATAREGSELGVHRILESWAAIGDNAAIIRFAEGWKGPRLDALDGPWAKAVALVEGPDAAAALIQSWADGARIQVGLASVTSAFMMARRFDDASAVFDALGAFFGGAENPLAAWQGKVKRLPPLDDYATPENALRSFYALLAAGPPDLAKRLGALLGIELSGDDVRQLERLMKVGGVGGLFGEGEESRWAIYDVIFGLATIKSEGDAKTGWRTKLLMPQMGRPNDDPRELGLAFFAPAGDDKVRLVGFEGSARVAQEALARLQKGDVEAARTWLGWAWQGAKRTPKAFEEPDASTPVEALWRIAFLVAAASPSLALDDMAASLEAGGKHLVGDERGFVLEAMYRRAASAAGRERLLATMDKVFAASPPTMSERAVRARTLALQGKKTEALALAAERLAVDPDDQERILEMANIEALTGELEQARARLVGLRDTGRLERAGHNELAWIELCVGQVGDGTLDSAKKGADKGNASAVHTRAMVEIERGLLDDGAASARALVGNDDVVEPSVWLVTGRMAEALGLDKLAIAYYGKVTGENEFTGPTSSIAVARQRVAKLGGPR